MSVASSPPLGARGPVLTGLLALVLLLGGFGTWAAVTEISGAIVAPGRVEVDRNQQAVQHPDGGVVAELAVDEGDLVAEGDLLMRLDPAELRSELAIVESQLLELMARRGRLEAERDDADTLEFDPLLRSRARDNAEIRDLMDGQQRLFDARRESIAREAEQLEKRAAQIAAQAEGIAAQQESLAEQIALIEQELGDQQSLLDRGLAQATRVLALRREKARLTGTLGELAARRAQTEGRATEIALEILKLKTARREEAITRLRDQQFRELELAEQFRALTERLARLDIRAPVSGVVHNLAVVGPRAVIRAADPVLSLVPQDRPLVIAARVQPINIDQVYLGQEVILRLTALDQRRTPELRGEVVQISAETFYDEATRAPYYRAEIILPEGEMARLPEGTALVPGMPVEAFIRTEDRTPLAYLVKPLADYFARAFRES